MFGITDEEAWGVGMTCGGRIEVLVESLASRHAVVETMIAAGRAMTPACMITDLQTGKALFFNPADAQGGEALPVGLEKAVRDAIDRGICAVVHEGGLDYYIHGTYPKPRLVVIGAVDIARVLARMALLADYSVVVIDPRGAFATKARFPDVDILVEWPDEALAGLTIYPRTAIVALTHDPKIDDVALGAALRSPAFYIGVLGSGKTHAARLERLGGEGFSATELARIHGPVGLGIGAKTPAEIAVSILAEIVKLDRKGPREESR
jgi:xanthine dehydrogenase accessory factor